MSQSSRVQRIVVVGSSGAGKTTLAKNLAARLGHPYVELDALRWDANWTAADRELFRSRIQTAIGTDAWVVDGNYSIARDLVWPRADTLIWLDYSLAVILPRLLQRTLRRGLTGEVLWNGNRENLAELFTRNSLVLWTLRTYFRHHREYPKAFEQPEHRHLQIFHLRSPRETTAWLKGLPPVE